MVKSGVNEAVDASFLQDRLSAFSFIEGGSSNYNETLKFYK